MSFTGFPPALLDFYAGLEEDNSRAYWQANKVTYESAIRAPLEQLAAALEGEVGETHIYRPYRDLRFSSDKRPYKENASMSMADGVDCSFYISIGADGLFLGGGLWHPARDQLQSWRQAVDDPGIAVELETLIRELDEAGFVLQTEDTLKTVPRGFPKDHPRTDLLRRTSLTVGKQFALEPWLHERRCLQKIREGLWHVRKWNTWLEQHVGSSTEEGSDSTT